MSTKISLTDVPGFRVGHAQDLSAATGCTAILCPPGTRAAVDQRGGAPGTRETDLLKPGRLVSEIHAVMLAGGSAFGLAAAQGAMRFLEDKGVGYQTRAGGVPIVPATVLYDLDVGSAAVRPDENMGYEACENSSHGPVVGGCVGVGTGCRVGALSGSDCATKSGIGNAGITLPSGVTVAVLIAVNTVGDVVDEHGKIIAGFRKGPQSPEFVGCESLFLGNALPESKPFGNTAIGVIATDGHLTRDELLHVAAMAHDGLARAVVPSHTIYDGDTLFALSAGDKEADANTVGIAAAHAVALAIRDAILCATSLGNVPAICDL